MASTKSLHDGKECRNRMPGPEGLIGYIGKFVPFLTSIGFRSNGSIDAQQMAVAPITQWMLSFILIWWHGYCCCCSGINSYRFLFLSR